MGSNLEQLAKDANILRDYEDIEFYKAPFPEGKETHNIKQILKCWKPILRGVIFGAGMGAIAGYMQDMPLDESTVRGSLYLADLEFKIFMGRYIYNVIKTRNSKDKP